METAQFARQTLVVQRTMFDSSFNAMVMAQEQTEKMLHSFMEKSPWVTADGKESLQKSIDEAKKARNEFKKAIDDGFVKFEGILAEQ